MAKQKFQLAKLDANNLKDLDGWKEKMETAVKENPYVKITNRETYEAAKKNRTALRTARTEIQNQDKMIGSVISKFRKQIISISGDLVAIVLPNEEKQQTEVTRWEKKMAEEKEKEQKIEEQRVDGIKRKINQLETLLSDHISLLTFENIDDTESLFKDEIASGSDFDFMEFEILLEEMLDRKRLDLVNQIKHVKDAEKLRLENLDKDQKAEINRRLVEAQRMIDLSNASDQHDLKERVLRVLDADGNFGDNIKTLTSGIKEMAKKVDDRVKEIQKAQTIAQKERIITVREGLLDIVHQMNIDDHEEKTEYVKDALNQKVEDLLVPGEFDKMVEMVSRALEDKLKVIKVELKENEDRLAKRLQGRLKIMKQKGFIELGSGFWGIKGLDGQLGEDDIYDKTDAEFYHEMKGWDAEIESANDLVERAKKYKTDKGIMAKIMDDLKSSVDFAESDFDHADSFFFMQEIEKEFAVWHQLKVEQINSF